jgi:hypothetical protein
LIYKDHSFSSLREPKRFIQLLRYFYKYGLNEQLSSIQSNKLEVLGRLRKVAILSFSLTYLLGLIDYSFGQGKSQREIYLKLICQSWTDFTQKKGQILQDYFKAPSPSEWTDLLLEETRSFSNIFIRPEDQISQNKAICENIWTVYHCTLTEIPLWIIGKPGSSKSLAVNLVHRMFVEKQSQDSRIKYLPQIYFQTYLCSTFSRPEGIMSQLSILTSPEKEFNKRTETTKRNIYILVLENIGHADLSP